MSENNQKIGEQIKDEINEGTNEQSKEKILIIDNDENYTMKVRRSINKIYDILVIESGKKAYNYLFSNKVSLIILNIDMPIVDGFKVYEKIKELYNCKKIPIIFVTSMESKAKLIYSSDNKLECLLKGSDDEENIIRNKIESTMKRYNEYKNRKSILIVDDDLEFLHIINGYLKDNYNVKLANTYDMAMKHLEKRTIDLLLLDYEMPIYNGVSLLRLIRGKEYLKDLPVIMVSGNSSTSVITELYQYKIKDYVKKPINKNILNEKIDRVLKGL